MQNTVNFSRGRWMPVVLFVVGILITGCGGGKWEKPYTPPPSESAQENPFVRINVPPESAGGVEAQAAGNRTSEQAGVHEKKLPASVKHIGAPLPSDKFASTSKSIKNKKDSGKLVHVELAFDNADLYEVLDVSLYDLFGLSYMVDPTLKTTVTLHITGDYTKDQFIHVFNQALQLNNLSVVLGAGNIYKILPKANSAGSGGAPAVNTDSGGAGGDITRLIRLRYVSVAAAATNITPFLSRGAQVVQDTVNNALLITDTPENIARAIAILGVIDVEYFSDVSWQIFPLKEVDAATVATDLDSVLKAGGLYKRQGAVEGGFEIFPIKSMNAILVVTRWPSILTLVQDWVQAMDHMTESESNVYVYFVENASAVDLADTLQQVFLGTSGSKTSKSSTAKTKKTSSLSTTGQGLSQGMTNPQKQTVVKPMATQTAKSGSGADEFSGNVEITPDEDNNAILFRANSRDYRKIYTVLKQLDIQPRQVLINVLIAEVTLTGSSKYGVEWLMKTNMAGATTVQGTLDSTSYTGAGNRALTTPLGSADGFTLGVYDVNDFMRGLVYALGSDSDVNILSSPNILALDNKEATIEVGDEIPMVTGTTTSATAGSTVTNTVQYRKTGVLLTVTPHINSSGLVKMDLTQEVSDVGDYIAALNNYKFLTRKADTSLVVSDGQTVVIGGLMRANVSNSQAGIPYLKDIPILGYLFGGVSKSKQKTELIIMITPHVIKNKSDADEITREFSQKLKYLKDSTKEKK